MKSKALERALTISQQYHTFSNKGKRSTLVELAAFGFDYIDIGIITGAPLAAIAQACDDIDASGYPERPMRWNIKTLDAMYYLALHYEDTAQVTVSLANLIVKNGTPLRSMARLTGISLEELRAGLGA